MESDETIRDNTTLAEKICEHRLAPRSYVFSILPHHGACDDVVQETCLFLWQRRDECAKETNFKAWAFRVAWFKAMAYRRDHQRENIVNFSESCLHQIAEAAETLADDTHERLVALRHCLSSLTPDQIRLLRLKYVDQGSLTDYARSIQQQPSRVQKTLSRLRLALRQCIESKLSIE